MVKTGITVVLVESVVQAIKFYTEKLGFDIGSLRESFQGDPRVVHAELRRGKCSIIFREPTIEESAEFSQIKHCLGRGTGILIELKTDIEKFFERCKSKEVKVLKPLTQQETGEQCFVLKDPFGVRIIVSQSKPGFEASSAEITYKISQGVVSCENSFIEKLVEHLRYLGVARRAAKKYGKRWLKSRK